jgi:ssDNA-binding Zn-finger/Zn-ribbon topoisomerase 1
MSEAFANAAKNARHDCPRCKGTGMYQYSTTGTPHFTVCDLCCRHNMGWWQLKEHYGENNGKWCCRAGCGKTVNERPSCA